MELSKDWRVVSPVDRHVMDYVTRESSADGERMSG
jgi:hypothetical protein